MSLILFYSTTSPHLTGTMGANAESFPELLLELHVVNVGKIKKSQVGFAVSASQTLTGVAKTGKNN